MSFTPLYKLFTTKEDRFAVYKAMELGMKPRKSKDIFEDFTNLLSDKDYEMDAIAERFNTSSVATGKSKAAELAESAGVDLLTIKQLIFCDLMANSDMSVGDFQPFMCSTVGEIDALGKRAFGYRWGEANADNNTSITVSYFSSALRRVMTKNKMCTITHPVVYPEMLREDKLYNGLGVLTLVACFLTAASLSHQTRYHDWGSSALKDYLTNKPDRVVRERLEKRIEEGFFLNLLCLRAEKYCEHAITGDVYGQLFAEGAVAHFIQEVNTPEAWDAYRRALLDCDSYREVAKCDFAFKHDYPFSSGTYEERAFFVNEIWFRYLKKDYANVLTSLRLTDDDTYWIIVSERECWPAGYREENKYLSSLRRRILSPVVPVAKSVNSSFKYDIDLPWDVDRDSMSDALIYTAYLDRVFWDWDLTEKSYSNQPCKGWQAENCKPVMLITDSCFISPLRRRGATLYFVFRTEDSVAKPLVLYVDNEEDRKFVEESAKSAGASLSNGKLGIGKNRVEVLPSKASTEMYNFPELDANLDTISKSNLYEELLRSTFLALMLTQSQTMFVRRSDRGGFLREWAYSAATPDESDTSFAKTVFTITDKGVVRNVVPAGYIETNVEENYLSSFGCLIFRLNERDIITDSIETCPKLDCLAFPFAEALSLFAKDSGRIEFAFVYLPMLFKDKCYKYVRWGEIPALVPEWKEEWSYIDSMSMSSLKVFFSAYSGLDLRRC